MRGSGNIKILIGLIRWSEESGFNGFHFLAINKYIKSKLSLKI